MTIEEAKAKYARICKAYYIGLITYSEYQARCAEILEDLMAVERK